MCNIRPYSRGKLNFIQNSDKNNDALPIKTKIGIIVIILNKSVLSLSSIYQLIDFNFLSDNRDAEILLRGLVSGRKLIDNFKRQDPEFWYYEVLPGLLFGNHLNNYLKWFSMTYFHACGTCKTTININIR